MLRLIFIVASFFALGESYYSDSQFSYPVATGFILVSLWMAGRLRWAGLPRTRGQIGGTLVFFLVCFYGSFHLVDHVLQDQRLGWYYYGFHWMAYLTIFCQALNQEMVLRGVSLEILRRGIGSVDAGMLLAILFAVAHLIFYYHIDGVLLGPTALLPLFLFGLVGNILYFKTGHIGYPLAIHAGWNLVRFNGEIIGVGSEAETFQALEGWIGRLLLSPLT